jgi:hypothetical protein
MDAINQLPEIVQNLSDVISGYMVETLTEDFVVYLRTESQILSLDNLFQYFLCEKLEIILSSKYLSALTQQK